MKINANYIITGLISLISLLFSSCSKEPVYPSVFINLEDEEFTYYLDYEIQEEGVYNVQFVFGSADSHYCKETDITAFSFREFETIHIRINDIQQPSSSCVSFDHSFEERINLSEITESVTHPVVFMLSPNIRYEGQLTVNQTWATLEFYNANNIKAIYDTTFLPDRGLHWYRTYFESRRSWLADEMCAEIDELSVGQPLGDGYYGLFHCKGRQIQLEQENEKPHLLHRDHYVRLPQYDSISFAKMDSLFTQYSERGRHQFTIELADWKGREKSY